MDENISALENLFQTVNEVRIEINRTWEYTEFRYRKDMSLFHSLHEKKDNFSVGKLCLYQKLEETEVPMVHDLIRNMKLCRNYLNMRFEWDRSITSVLITLENKKPMWDCLLETYKVLEKFIEHLELLLSILQSFRNLVRFLNSP